MDFKRLFEEGKYEEILSLTEKESEAEPLYFRLASLLALSKEKEAIALLSKRRETLFRKYPLETLKANFSLRILLRQYEEAYEDYKAFSSFPYQRQEVEEALADIPRALRTAERQESLSKSSSPSDVRKILSSGDSYSILTVLKAMKKEDFPAFEAEVVSLLRKETVHPFVRTYALLFLLSLSYSRPVTFLKNGSLSTLKPSELTPPFESGLYLEIVEELPLFLKDPSAANAARSILDEAILLSYPDDFLNDKKKGELLSALSSLSFDYLRSKGEKKRYPGASKEESEDYAKEISSLLTKEPPLSY